MKIRKVLTIICTVLLLVFILLPNITSATEISNTEESENSSFIVVIRESIATWYYILRTISIALMLLVLIFIGIKIATSTLAGDRAMYKSMLIDWVAGMVLVFSIHYIMIFIFNVNETLVSTVKNFSEAVYEANPDEYGLVDNKELSNKDVEVSIYETIRTRAYDPKLINGTTGMVMYIWIIFCSYKFTFIYLKRFFYISILTLMAPIVAVSYAFSKVLKGRGQIFSRWLKEYIFNVILQTIHAILYVTFLLIALRLSLNSLSGMILSFAILNFMGNADKIFRKIFAVGGNGGLASELAEGAVKKPDEVLKDIRSLRHAYFGSQILRRVAKAEREAFFRKPGRALFGKVMSVARGRQERSNNENKYYSYKSFDSEGNEVDVKTEFTKKDIEKFEKDERVQKILGLQDSLDELYARKEIGDDTEQTLDREIKEKEAELQVELYDFSKSFKATKFALVNKFKDVFNPRNYTEEKRYTRNKNGHKKGEIVRDKNGNVVYQGIKSKKVNGKEIDSLKLRLKQNLNSQKMFGTTDKTKKAFSKQLTLLRQHVESFIEGFVGAGLIFEKPLIAAALIGKSAMLSANLRDYYRRVNTPYTVDIEKLSAYLNSEQKQKLEEKLELEKNNRKNQYIEEKITHKNNKVLRLVTSLSGKMINGVSLYTGRPAMLFTRSLKSTPNNMVIRSNGLGYAETETAINELYEQSKAQRAIGYATYGYMLNGLIQRSIEKTMRETELQVEEMPTKEQYIKAITSGMGMAIIAQSIVVPVSDNNAELDDNYRNESILEILDGKSEQELMQEATLFKQEYKIVDLEKAEAPAEVETEELKVEDIKSNHVTIIKVKEKDIKITDKYIEKIIKRISSERGFDSIKLLAESKNGLKDIKARLIEEFLKRN